MNENIVITEIQVTPRIVDVGETFKIAANIEPIIRVLGDDTSRIIDNDGAYIQIINKETWVLSDSDNCLITDLDGICIYMHEEI